MERKEIEKKIEELEEQIFIIKMADFMSREDWNMIADLQAKIRELKEKM